MQQLLSMATWDSCILLMQEVGDVGGDCAAQKHHGRDTAICMPSSFTSHEVRHYTETRATLVQLFYIVFL